MARSELGHVGMHPLFQRLHGSSALRVPRRCPAQSLFVDLVLPIFGGVDPPRERVPGTVSIAASDSYANVLVIMQDAHDMSV